MRKSFSFKTNTSKIERTQTEKYSILGSLIFSEHSNHWRKYESISSVSMHVFFRQHEAVHANIKENSEHLH